MTDDVSDPSSVPEGPRTETAVPEGSATEASPAGASEASRADAITPEASRTEATEPGSNGPAPSDPSAPSGPSGKTQAWINLAAFGLLLLLFGGDLLDAFRAQRAEVTAMAAPPGALFAAIALVLTFIAAGASVFGFLKKKGAGFRGHRLLPILASILLFVDLLVLSDGMDFPSHELTAAALGHLEQRASNLSQIGQVASDPAVLEPILAELGRPPYLVKGEPLTAWQLELRTGCEGPVNTPEGRPAGTLFYCVSKDGGQAWLTAVGLDWMHRFGPPEIVGSPRGILLGTVAPVPMQAPPPSFGGPDAFRDQGAR